MALKPITTSNMASIRDFNKSHLAPESTIIKVTDESLYHVNEALASSSQARGDFRTKYSNIIHQYELDIAELDQELAKIPPSLASFMQSKDRRKTERAGQRNRRSRLGLSNKSMRPANESSDDVSIWSGSSSKRITSTNIRSKAGEGQDKVLARSQLLEQMSTMLEFETRLEKKLACSGRIGVTDQERKETEAALLRLQTSNSEKIIEMITAYKPRINHAIMKKDSALNAQSLRDIMDEAQAQESSRANLKPRRDTGIDLPIPRIIRSTSAMDHIDEVTEEEEDDADDSEYMNDSKEFS